jgi:Mg2+ and Co2+ transporter CorA
MSKLLDIVSPILGEKDLIKFNSYIKQNKINDARLLIERQMIEHCEHSIQYAVLNEVQDALINEIEVMYDDITTI